MLIDAKDVEAVVKAEAVATIHGIVVAQGDRTESEIYELVETTIRCANSTIGGLSRVKQYSPKKEDCLVPYVEPEKYSVNWWKQLPVGTEVYVENDMNADENLTDWVHGFFVGYILKEGMELFIVDTEYGDNQAWYRCKLKEDYMNVPW